MEASEDGDERLNGLVKRGFRLVEGAAVRGRPQEAGSRASQPQMPPGAGCQPPLPLPPGCARVPVLPGPLRMATVCPLRGSLIPKTGEGAFLIFFRGVSAASSKRSTVSTPLQKNACGIILSGGGGGGTGEEKGQSSLHYLIPPSPYKQANMPDWKESTTILAVIVSEF